LPVVFGVSAMVLAQAPNGMMSILRLPDLSAVAARRTFRLDRRRSHERIVAVLAAEGR